MFNKTSSTKKLNLDLNLANTFGIVELDDGDAEKHSGGYHIRFFGKDNRFIDFIDVDLKPGVDETNNTNYENAQYFSIEAEEGSEFVLTTKADGKRFRLEQPIAWQGGDLNYGVTRTTSPFNFSKGFSIDRVK